MLVTEVTEWSAPIMVTSKKATDHTIMCRFIQPKLLCIEAKISITYTVRDSHRHCCRRATICHNVGCNEGVSAVSIRCRKSSTYNTPFDCFSYLRAPYCLLSLAEDYNHHMAEAFEGLSRVRRVVNDVIIFHKDEVSHVESNFCQIWQKFINPFCLFWHF